MFRRSLLQATRNPPIPRLRKPPARWSSAQPPPHPPASSERIARFNRRLPRSLHKYTNALVGAPITHITSFLLLHEITAVVPLLGLAAGFHYTHWLPGWFAEGAWALQGVERFGKYFRKKGWIRPEEATEAEQEVQADVRRRDRAWDLGEGGARLVVEFATAYTITKLLLPARIILSVWGTPWFARVAVIPSIGLAKRLFGRAKPKAASTTSSGAAGNRAHDAGVEPKASGTKNKRS